MTKLRLVTLTTMTMIAFAGNSLFCRMALKETAIDAATFTSVRLLSAAVMLWLLMSLQRKAPLAHGSWRSATALFIYAVSLSFAYRSIDTGAGALMLFGAVQATMLIAGFIAGERMTRIQAVGFVSAMIGLVILVSPSVEAPSVLDSILMLGSGVAWGVYSMFGRGQPHPAAATAGNFLRAAPMTVALSLIALPWLRLDMQGVLYAVLSGAVTSALGYVLWYRVLQHMRAMTASTVQLSAPVIAAIAGILLLDEAVTRDLLVSSVLILGGILLVLRFGKR
ncbi:MAG: DMT family transporter [Gammaproteobacteria bacterium]|nr:DMT family transporter [Gammaproteobacteria bacterium]MBU1625020.1 DMT family transporter [Gammaproteobacteria bacterium]MBU1981280.1 DMT family transporter [Gammaproteobacteria bacterium]